MLAVLLVGMAACNKVDESSLIAAAQERLDRSDYAGAEIEIRNLLGANAHSPMGRYMLAKVLLTRGDLLDAQKELERAADYGHPEELVVPLMAEVLVEQNRAAAAIERYRDKPLADSLSAAHLYTQLARAYQATGDLIEAESMAAEALKRVPDFAPALVARARIAGAQGNGSAAAAIARELTTKQPSYALGWVLQGDIQARSPGNEEAAIQAYRKALALYPKLVIAHSGLLSLYQRLGDKEAMKAQAAAMGKALPGNPTTLFYEALVAYDQGEFAKARERLQFLLRRAEDRTELLYLAGLTEARLGALAFAETLLSRAAAASPGASGPRLALAELYMRMGETERALTHLNAALAADPHDVRALFVLGVLHARNGDFRAADEALTRAAKRKPNDPRIRAAVGRTMLARGLVEPGLRELHAASQLDTGSVDHDIEIIMFHMRRNEPEAALKVADEMARKQPKSAIPDHLRGRIRQAMGDIDGATKAYEHAVAKDPRHLPAISSLAEIDIAAQRLGAARKRYEAYLQLEPRSSQAMVALAVLTRRSGGSRDEANKWIDKALAASPNDSRIWRQAIEFQQRDGDTLDALSLAQKANEVIPDNAEVRRLLASAQLAAGDKGQAISSLEDVVRLQPNSVDAHIFLGLTQLSLGNVAAARSAIDSAAKLAPEWPPVLRARVTLALAGDKDLAKARAIAAKQQTAHPKQALGWQLEGEIEGGQHNWPAAIAAFQQAMAKESSSTIAKQLHDAMMRAEQQDEAAAHAQRWLASHPSDLEFLTHLARWAMKQKDFAAAGEHLRAALKLRPNDAVLLNNLAMTELELQHPDALETAQRAVKLAPHHPAILDTLAQALSTHSTLDKAIETQALAVALAPQSSTLRLRLARYYIEANRKQEAREQLRLLTHSGTPRADRDAAEKLLAQLPG